MEYRELEHKVEELDRKDVEELDREVVDVLPVREELIFNAQGNVGGAAAGLVAVTNLQVI